MDKQDKQVKRKRNDQKLERCEIEAEEMDCTLFSDWMKLATHAKMDFLFTEETPGTEQTLPKKYMSL